MDSMTPEVEDRFYTIATFRGECCRTIAMETVSRTHLYQS